MADTMFGTLGRIAGTKTGILLIVAWVAALALMVAL